MLKESFLIDERYLVDPTLNNFRDTKSGDESRIEPRLMSVLCLLAGQPGQLLSREQLIDEVWAGYGGADEALNQAISYLRKLLHDEAKELIQTIPKKGYRLQAAVTNVAALVVPPVAELKKRSVPFWVWIMIIVLLLVGAGVYFFTSHKSEMSKNNRKHSGAHAQPQPSPAP